MNKQQKFIFYLFIILNVLNIIDYIETGYGLDSNGEIKEANLAVKYHYYKGDLFLWKIIPTLFLSFLLCYFVLPKVTNSYALGIMAGILGFCIGYYLLIVINNLKVIINS